MRPLHAAITVLLLTSCGVSRDVAKEFGTGAFVIVGTMTHLAIEGGCWQFKSDEGTTYELFGDQATLLHKDGERAQIIVREISNAHTICMAGKPVELLKITKIY